MSGQQARYDDGYGHQPHGNTDSYYQDDQAQYYDHHAGGAYAEPAHGHHQGGDGYYDEAYVLPPRGRECNC